MGYDYGRGTTNIDNETGIRYGVISQNEVLQAWADSSEPFYGEVCECGSEEGDECPDCGLPILGEFAEPLSFIYTGEGYAAECGDDGDIFLLRAPYFTRCEFCSPCAPGAGYIMNSADDCPAYCFGHDWFEEGKAPYRVFSVETGEEVFP
jgi:hypothetical protein